jgi:hypothetical protein
VVPALEQFEIFLPGTPPMTPHEDMAIDFSCDEALLDRKVAALTAHESQIEGLLEVFGADGLRRFIRDECYWEASRKEA